jgi:hypothetical protein
MTMGSVMAETVAIRHAAGMSVSFTPVAADCFGWCRWRTPSVDFPVGTFVAAKLSSCNIATMSALTLHHRFYDMLMQSQYWSAERMQEHQRSQLAQLLRHAKKSVPF